MDKKQGIIMGAVLTGLLLVVIALRVGQDTQILLKLQKQDTEILTVLKASTQPAPVVVVPTPAPTVPKHP